MKKKLVALALFFAIHINLTASVKEYLYKIDDPTFSNWGSSGLVNMPSARFQEEGTLAINIANHDPYTRLAGIAYPFAWMEAVYQYTDIRDRLYSEVFAFSGNQTFKDKGFDVKFRIMSEQKFLPAVAVGLKDIAGTSLFSSEYLVASKFYKNIDFTAGIGWGTMSDNAAPNPLKIISQTFAQDRGSFTGEGSKGGTFSTSSYFRSKEIGLFGGMEIFFSSVKGLRLKLEYDSTNYILEGNKPQTQDSPINFSISYSPNTNFSFYVGQVRGNTLQAGFTLKKNFSKKSKSLPKNDHVILESSNDIKKATALGDRYLYLASLKYLKEESINVRSVGISDHKLSIAFSQSKYTNYAKAYGRAAAILDQIAHDNITEFELLAENRTYELSAVVFDRRDFVELKESRDYLSLKSTSNFSSGHNKADSHQYRPKFNYPVIFYSVAPDFQTHFGGADRFFAGSLDLMFQSEVLLNNQITFQLKVAHALTSTLDVLEQGSDSILPHVRTDSIQYLKEGSKAAIKRAQFNYFAHPKKSIYYKFSAGIFESMFGGAGGEILYRPFGAYWGIGMEAYSLTQREYNQRFKFRDYQTETAHIKLYLSEPSSGLLFQLVGGKYLAKDSGITMDVSRIFKSGLTMGVYASRTDISYEEFGEGSFDKGFYFFMPLDTFISSHTRKLTGFGMRPLTRDGAQRANIGLDLWGVTSEGSIHNIHNSFDGVYE